MKKLLGIVVLGLLLSGNVNAGWLSNNPSLFGIELDSNISNYKQKKCLINHNYDNLGLDNFILTQYSKRDSTGPNWSDWIYTNSKLPVSEGCIEPNVPNEDFFNFNVKIFPKTKEVYEVSALYKKVYKYKGKDLEDLLLLSTLDNKKSNKKQISVRGTQCSKMAKDIADVVIGSLKKKTFKFGNNKSFSDSYKYIGSKGKGGKPKIEIFSSCSIKAKNNNWILKSDNYYSFPFLIKISISYDEWYTANRVKTEEKFLYEASRGNANPDINTKGLE
jgi:hypothetical protein